MHLLYSTSVLLALAQASLAELTAKEGYSITRILLPIGVDGAHMSAIGSGGPNDEVTTYAYAQSADNLETPFLNITIGPSTMNYVQEYPVTLTHAKHSVVYTTAAMHSNCTFSEEATRTQAGGSFTAKCTKKVIMWASDAVQHTYDYTSFPQTSPAGGSRVFYNDGLIDVYVKAEATSTESSAAETSSATRSTTAAGVSTSVQPAAGAEVTAWVKGVVVLAAGAAAFAV